MGEVPEPELHQAPTASLIAKVVNVKIELSQNIPTLTAEILLFASVLPPLHPYPVKSPVKSLPDTSEPVFIGVLLDRRIL